jgi:TP901 family phage tail tape measure protein
MAYDLVARLRLVDNMTAPLRRVTASFERTNSAVKQVTRATNVYRDANGRLRDQNGRFVAENKRLANSFNILGMSLGRFTGILSGLAGGVAATKFAFTSFSKAMDFEAQMSSIQALTGATNEEMKRMSALAIKMGADTKYSALEAAQGIEELLKAGLTPAQVEAGGLEAALNLATAGELELADAAEIMSTAMNAFRRDALTAAQASDILAGTANASATSVQELRYSLAMVSAVAAGVGMTFKDTNTALGLFANNGLKGSDAGTSLKTMLANLQPTTKDQIKLFKRLGLMTSKGANAFFDARGKLKSLEQIAGILRKSLSGLTDQQRMLALETMFGSDAIRAATILFNEGAEGVRKFQAEMTKVTALDVAKKKMDNAKGAIEQLQGAIETIQISALQPLLPTIKQLALLFADMAEQYGPQITATFENIGKSIQKFLEPYLNDPKTWKVATQAEFKFKQAEMLDNGSSPPPFWDNLMGAFNRWLDSGGQEMLNGIAKKTTDILADAVEAGAPRFAEAGIVLGKALGNAVIEGAVNIFDKLFTDPMQYGENFERRKANNAQATFGFLGVPAPTPAEIAERYERKKRNMKWFDDFLGTLGIGSGADGNHYHGIEYVPRDGYTARLHKGERVLTAAENREYSAGQGGVQIGSIVINAAGGDIRDPEVVEYLTLQLAREIHSARMNGA